MVKPIDIFSTKFSEHRKDEYQSDQFFQKFYFVVLLPLSLGYFRKPEFIMPFTCWSHIVLLSFPIWIKRDEGSWTAITYSISLVTWCAWDPKLKLEISLPKYISRIELLIRIFFTDETYGVWMFAPLSKTNSPPPKKTTNKQTNKQNHNKIKELSKCYPLTSKKQLKPTTTSSYNYHMTRQKGACMHSWTMILKSIF